MNHEILGIVKCPDPPKDGWEHKLAKKKVCIQFHPCFFVQQGLNESIALNVFFSNRIP